MALFHSQKAGCGGVPPKLPTIVVSTIYRLQQGRALHRQQRMPHGTSSVDSDEWIFANRTKDLPSSATIMQTCHANSCACSVESRRYHSRGGLLLRLTEQKPSAHSTDHHQRQNATECTRKYLLSGQVREWGIRVCGGLLRPAIEMPFNGSLVFGRTYNLQAVYSLAYCEARHYGSSVHSLKEEGIQKNAERLIPTRQGWNQISTKPHVRNNEASDA